MKSFVALRNLLPIVFFVATSCGNKSTPDDPNVQRTYYPDGKIHKEIVMKNGKKTGAYKEYFSNGQLFEEVNFVNDKREGLDKKYCESGTLFEEIPYRNGKMHGVRKKYRRTGELMSEIPYDDGNQCVGLKEYTIDGKLKVRYPTIVVTPKDRILIDGTYTLEISLSDGTKGNVEYFEGKLTDGRYIGEDVGKVWKVKDGIGTLEFKIAPGTFLMEEMHFIAKMKTVQSNYFITETTYNLAVENKF